jgi:hypothetical protein
MPAIQPIARQQLNTFRGLSKRPPFREIQENFWWLKHWFQAHAQILEFSSLATTCRQAAYGGSSFCFETAGEKPSRNYLKSAFSQLLAFTQLAKPPILVWSFSKTSNLASDCIISVGGIIWQ